jgi:hypothetical protein
MKTVAVYVALLLAMMSTGASAQKKDQWTYLFNGKSTAALRGYKMNSFPADAWKVEDGALVAQTGVPNIDLVTKENYKNFELVLDGEQWRVLLRERSRRSSVRERQQPQLAG